MKFLNKASLKEFVTANQALRCWGGEDDYVFNFIPETRHDNNSVVANSQSSSKKVN